MNETDPPLALFPLQAVLFPGGRIGLRVFEARYLDLVSARLRDQRPFGVVCLRQGHEVGADDVQLETVGVLAFIEEVDSEQAGILRVRCLGGSRFEIVGTAWRNDDGLWTADIDFIADDAVEAPAPSMLGAVNALAQAIHKLSAQHALPFAEPFRLDDAGWVANRWCELLPISLAAKQKLMALESPTARLQLVDEFLRGKGVIAA